MLGAVMVLALTAIVFRWFPDIIKRALVKHIEHAYDSQLGACAVGRFRLSTVENQIQYFAHSADIVVICPIFTHGKQRHVGRCPMNIFYGASLHGTNS